MDSKAIQVGGEWQTVPVERSEPKRQRFEPQSIADRSYAIDGVQWYRSRYVIYGDDSRGFWGRLVDLPIANSTRPTLHECEKSLRHQFREYVRAWVKEGVEIPWGVCSVASDWVAGGTMLVNLEERA